MTRHAGSYLLIAALMAAAPARPQTAAAAAQLTGTVRNYLGRGPLEGVRVLALDARDSSGKRCPDSGERAKDITEKDGSYLLKELPAAQELEVQYCLVGHSEYPARRPHLLAAGQSKTADDVLLIEELLSDAEMRQISDAILTAPDKAAEIRILEQFNLPVQVNERISRFLGEQAAARGLLADVFFDADSYSLSPDAQAKLTQNAALLRELPFVVTVGGHDDGQTSNDISMAISERRAQAARDFLVALGVSSSQIRTLSYGEARPVCSETTEACERRNRRASFTLSLPLHGRG